MPEYLTFRYSADFGDCDGSDEQEYELELTHSEAEAYHRALKNGTELWDVPELDPALERARAEIIRMETDNARAMGDEYALQCLGEAPVSAEELNELVYARDPAILAFLGLTGLSDEELDAWDASSLKQRPMRRDFDPDFEPMSPFECDWCLNVDFPYPEDLDYETDDEE